MASINLPDMPETTEDEFQGKSFAELIEQARSIGVSEDALEDMRDIRSHMRDLKENHDYEDEDTARDMLISKIEMQRILNR